MKLSPHRADAFNSDFDLQYRWYLEHANESVAERYVVAVRATLELLAAQPDLGRRRKFRHSALRSIRSFRLVSPFGVHLIFYRHSATEFFAERLMHGGRNLPRRLAEPPGSSD